MNKKDMHFLLTSIIIFCVLIVFATICSLLYRSAFLLPNTAVTITERTFDAGNVITQYELFYDRFSQIKAAKEKIVNTEQQLNRLRTDLNVCEDGNTEDCTLFANLGSYDKDSINVLRNSVLGQRNTLASVVEQYNADTQKINKRIFNGTGCKTVTTDIELECIEIPYEINADTFEGLFYNE